MTILAVGRAKTAFYDDAISEYQKRLGRHTKLDLQIVPTSDVDTESRQLLRGITPGAHTILLDERGTQLSTPELSETIERLQNNATKSVVFIIGGAHGVNDALRDRVDQTWSLSKLVFPHELVRVVVAEQLYRAYDLLVNGKYHHT